MNILTLWRQALVAHLAENLPVHSDYPGDWDVRSGVRDGAWKESKLAVVFVPSIGEDGGDVNFARPPMIVRAWLPRSDQPRDTDPLDPGPLEQLAVDLMQLLEPVQTTLVDGLYFRVSRVDIDYDDWGVQAVLTSFMLNPASVS